jgi:hypothetical protein
VALLSAAEEVELANRIEAGLFAAERLTISGLEGCTAIDARARRELRWIVRDGQRHTGSPTDTRAPWMRSGHIYGVTRRRISQIEAKTMVKPRHAARGQGLRDYLTSRHPTRHPGTQVGARANTAPRTVGAG